MCGSTRPNSAHAAAWHPLELFTDYALAARLWFLVALVATAYAVLRLIS
jgi:hypothetical protein